MSSDDDDSAIDAGASYGLWGRVILFLVIVGPGSLIAFGLWVRIGLRASTHTGAGRSDSLTMFFILWLLGTLGTAYSVFKK
jgi:hypothetical protein